MRHNIIYGILTAILLISCSEQYDAGLGLYPTLTPRYIALIPSSLNFTHAKSEQSVNITSADTPWKLENSIDWVTLSAVSGNTNATINVGVSENTKGDEIRTGIFYLKSDVEDWKFESPVSVTQAGAVPTILLSKDAITFSGTANKESVSITANCQYEVTSDKEWIALNSSGNTIEINVTANETRDYRQGYVNVIHKGNSNVTKSITIQQAPATINASTESLVFNNTASEVEITINSESQWTANTSVSWIEIAPTSGNAGSSTMKVSVPPNTSTNERNGYILLYIGGRQCVQIPVRQRGIFIEVENNAVTFKSTGGTENLSVLSNTSWTISSHPEWITIDKTTGEGNAIVKITAADNPNTSSRSGQMHIIQQGLSIDCIVDITQDGKSFEVNSTVLNFEDKRSSQTINVVSDGTWRASTNASWISVSPTSATGNGTLTVTVEENTEDNERQGEVSVTLGDKTSTIHVVQKGKYFTVDNAMLTYTSKGGNINISVSTNDSWTAKVEDSPSWLKLSATSGSGSMDIVATASDNPSVNKRTAKIIIETVNHQSVRIVVTQDARYLNVDTREVLFYSKGGDSEPITISTDGTYKITASDSWFSTKVNADKLIVTATENKTTEPRIGTIKIELTDLKEGTYALTLTVTQLNYGGSFLLQGFNDDVNYDNGSTTTIGDLKITWFTEDKNWDKASSSRTMVNISGYANDTDWDTSSTSSTDLDISNYDNDKDWDTTSSSNTTVSVSGYGNDTDWDTTTSSGTPSLNVDSYGEDQNWDSSSTSSTSVDVAGYGDDTDWDSSSSSGVSLTVTGYTSDTNWDTSSSSSLTVTITSFTGDKNLDSSSSSTGQIEKTEYNSDNNWD